MPDEQMIRDLWPTVVGMTTFLLSVLCSGHALLHKRDSRAATGWVGIIWLAPIVGCILYFLLGINRVRRLARSARGQAPSVPPQPSLHAISEKDFGELRPKYLAPLNRLGGRVTHRPLLAGNRIIPLENGDAAYPPMLTAIENARHSITLSTYIFDNDPVGRRFTDALSRAVSRGVQVRVLIDDIGLRYSWRSILRQLRRGKVPVARFMGAVRPRTFPHLNLRKHRKVLIADGVLAFSGGMNIRAGHELLSRPRHPVQDLHFQIEGPLVQQLQEVFADDWAFTTKEILEGAPWFVEPPVAGRTLARAITDGPDENLDQLPLMIGGAIATARESIWIVTPYFLPDFSLITALYIAAGKGVSVNLILPAKNNLSLVQWAMYPLLPQLLRHGCRIWFSAPPFDHSKLMLVDDEWVLFGSANWDPRSLRLNFELNVECYDAEFGAATKSIIDRKLKSARQLDPSEFRNRPLVLRLRDGIARLFSPYL